MRQYLEVCRRIMRRGVDRKDRTGTGTRALFAQPVRFDLRQGFPIITTKYIPFRLVLAELLWFLVGDSNVYNLQKLGAHIWDADAFSDRWLPKARFPGDAGRIYGVQWRQWRSPSGYRVDQLSKAIDTIKTRPWDRRIIVTAWNPGELDQMCLPPCHMFFQLFVANGGLSLSMYQRSCDMLLGVPFNISSYALLLSILAQIAHLEPHELIITLGDAHIYSNHFGQIETQLQRQPFPLPKIQLSLDIRELDDLTASYESMLSKESIDHWDLDAIARLEGYQYHPHISGPLNYKDIN